MKFENYSRYSAKLTLDHCENLEVVCDPGGIEPTETEIGFTVSVHRISNTQRVVLVLNLPNHPAVGITYESDDGTFFLIDEPNCPTRLTIGIEERAEWALRLRQKGEGNAIAFGDKISI